MVVAVRNPYMEAQVMEVLPGGAPNTVVRGKGERGRGKRAGEQCGRAKGINELRT